MKFKISVMCMTWYKMYKKISQNNRGYQSLFGLKNRQKHINSTVMGVDSFDAYGLVWRVLTRIGAY